MGVLVVAYNAAATLVETLSRLPESFAATVDHVMVCDDASSDDTYAIGLAYQSGSRLPMTMVRHPENLGYGGNQKAGYDWAISHGLDVVVLLHGDGQYAPEVIETIVGPLLTGEADAVFGSRMMRPGAALKGGMPVYKFLGNKILTGVQNRLAGLELTEWHSGYRAYRVDALRDIDFASYSNGFDFDTEIILGLHDVGKRIIEVPIPTYYGDEICYVNGMKYAKDVIRDVLRFKARRMGFGAGSTGLDETAYELKPSAHSSHGHLLAWLSALPPSRVLDVGCSDGRFGELVRELGHHVVGVDVVKHEGVAGRLDGFVEADLSNGLPAETGAYDVVVAGDILEHVTDPAQLLESIRHHLAPGGEVLVSVPNFGHWYPRGRVALGRFDYDQRGPLDQGHVRFFTRKSFERLVAAAQMRIVERDTVGSPVDVLDRGGETLASRLIRGAAVVDRAATRSWPTLFGYQFLYRLVPA
ncbi:MAG: bifunctional glycosyltransferase/class I SAM-dependent methyltransferase [Marmoricola sp.]